MDCSYAELLLLPTFGGLAQLLRRLNIRNGRCLVFSVWWCRSSGFVSLAWWRKRAGDRTSPGLHKMADDCSRLWHLTDDQLVSYFNSLSMSTEEVLALAPPEARDELRGDLLLQNSLISTRKVYTGKKNGKIPPPRNSKAICRPAKEQTKGCCRQALLAAPAPNPLA